MASLHHSYCRVVFQRIVILYSLKVCSEHCSTFLVSPIELAVHHLCCKEKK